MNHKITASAFAASLIVINVFGQGFVNCTGTTNPTCTTLYVGVGTTAPNAQLQVANGSLWVSGDSGPLPSAAGAGAALKYTSNAVQLYGYDYGGTGPKALILQGPGGNVGIGTTTASARLQVAGSAFIAGDSGALSQASGPGLGLKYSPTTGAHVYGYD
jgi:hypothetical protein